MTPEVLASSDAIRHVAVNRDGALRKESQAETLVASEPESDRYEELLVNPTRLTNRGGEIDCGGLDYVLVRYGSFFQLGVAREWGHVSVCIEKSADPVEIAGRVQQLLG